MDGGEDWKENYKKSHKKQNLLTEIKTTKTESRNEYIYTV